MEDGDHDVVMEGVSVAPSASGSVTNGFVDPRDLLVPSREDSNDVQSFFEGLGDNDSDEDDRVFDPQEYPEYMRRRGQLPTGCCYDDRMKLHSNADFGSSPHHPEDPSRIEEIFKTLKRANLVFKGSDAELVEILKTNPNAYLWRIPAREASREEICLAHDPKHYAWVQSLADTPTQELRELSRRLDQGRASLYVGSMTYEASLISAGGAIETCKAVVSGEVKNAFAVIRPPGHHAEWDAPMGFCLFNNVPVAAKVCQKEFPDICRKILIVDWDVHHGNGIQNIFYDDPNVLYISTHVYDGGEFYPGKPDNPSIPDGGIDKCGDRAGLGRNVNIGWDKQGMGDGEYMAAFQKIIMPIGREFDPDLVIISSGFDAAAGDQLGGCFVSPECYAHMTHMLMSLAGGKVAVCLEGGYNLHAISQSALSVVRTLMGEPPPRMPGGLPPINREAARLLSQVQAFQAPFWECMRPGIVDVPDALSLGAERLHDMVREAQRQKLATEFGMLPLYIQRDRSCKSFENQVLVTPDINDARKIIVIIHDPPELHAQPDPLDNSLSSHNAWVHDGVYGYIKWAIQEKFGVIDINVPQYITLPEDTDSFTQRTPEQLLQHQVQEIVGYVWDNYLQLYDNVQDIILLGVGAAYLGIKTLLINRDCKSRITGVLSFVTGSLRPVKSDTDPDLSTWYKNNSRIYVGNAHACWQSEDLASKVKKRRFGSVLRSPHDGLNRMMKHHAEEARDWIQGRVAPSPSLDGDTTEDDDGAPA
ncbi:hypothetical protein RB595_005345 [Gaeumannomyces hyphopodioides]